MSSISQSIKNFAGVSPKAKALSQNDNDVVIVAAVRSAITKVRVTFCLAAEGADSASVWEGARGNSG